MKKESREKSMIAFIRVFGSVASSNSELLLLLLEDPYSPLEYLLLSFLVVLFASAYAEIFIYVLFLKDNYLEEARKMRNLHFFTGRFARGGISKASHVININEDIYAGFNSTFEAG